MALAIAEQSVSVTPRVNRQHHSVQRTRLRHGTARRDGGRSARVGLDAAPEPVRVDWSVRPLRVPPRWRAGGPLSSPSKGGANSLERMNDYPVTIA